MFAGDLFVGWLTLFVCELTLGFICFYFLFDELLRVCLGLWFVFGVWVVWRVGLLDWLL